MKNPTENPTEKTPQRTITRREFVGGALATGGLVAGAPALLRGRNLNDRLNIAFIGSGGRANANLRELTISRGRDRRTGRRIRMRGRIRTRTSPCSATSASRRSTRRPRRSRRRRSYKDFRKIFDRPNDFDAVVVSTAESTHAVATYLALTHGKHVYCEKPLTYNIWEARLIRETAAKYPKLSTQMGNQGHALPHPPRDQGDPQHRRDRSGARSARLGRSRVGPAGRRVRGEVRQGRTASTRASRSSSGSRRRCRFRPATTSICGSVPRPRGRSTRRISPARAGIAGGTSATAR